MCAKDVHKNRKLFLSKPLEAIFILPVFFEGIPLLDISCGLSISSTFLIDLGLKQNLQIKTFLDSGENAVKSQIFVAMIVYLLLELVRRVHCKGKTAFSNFCEKVRICLLHYLSFEYLCSSYKNITLKILILSLIIVKR